MGQKKCLLRVFLLFLGDFVAAGSGNQIYISAARSSICFGSSVTKLTSKARWKRLVGIILFIEQRLRGIAGINTAAEAIRLT